MTFLVDENLPFDLVRLARDRRLDALWVRDVMPGAKDSLILKRLTEQKEVLVTRDIGFANLVFIAGIIWSEIHSLYKTLFSTHVWG